MNKMNMFGLVPASCALTCSTWYRALSPVALLSFLAVTPLGCAFEEQPAAEEMVDVESQAADGSWKCNVDNINAPDCQDAIADIRGQAAAVGRSEIVERGISWLEQGVLYDPNAFHVDGYRRDCSGFVSMAWQYTANPGTGLFPPFADATYAVALGSFDELVPGDAVNRIWRKKNSDGNSVGHVRLFAGWASPDHSQLYFLHHSGGLGEPVSLIQVSGYEGDYIPIRSVNAPAPTTEVPPPDDPEPPPDCGALLPGQSLGVDQGATSCDGRFTLVQQGDGNLVLYQDGVGALWSNEKNGTNARTTVMQDDGNLVSYTPEGEPIWHTNTFGNPGAWLSIGDDGSLVIHAADQLIWWNLTGGK